MGSRLGRRVIHFANLPIKVLLPSPPFDSIREFALKTIPSASKIEIRRVLESLYGFEIDDVRTLNMEGKKKKRGGYLTAKPDYKKAYITLKHPLSLSPDLFPVPWIQEAMQQKLNGKKKGNKAKVVDEGDGQGQGQGGDGEGQRQQRHWMDEERRREEMEEERRGDKRRGVGWVKGNQRKGKGTIKEEEESSAKFPWSSMRSWRR